MNQEVLNKTKKEIPEYQDLVDGKEMFWINPKRKKFKEVKDSLPVQVEEIEEARQRLERFAPFIEKVFPETQERKGIIESPLVEVKKMKQAFLEEDFPGDLWLKLDSHLAVAGSVKARGGIYEVLKHTEDLALENGLLDNGDYAGLGDPDKRAFFQDYTIQVGSTGNLGLSIGISSAQIGYKVVVHMSHDAKEWKKELLRSHGVTVKEYKSDYSLAVKEGRAESEKDPKSYFIDDENSVDLFMGYAVSAKRLKKQIEDKGRFVDKEHPLCVYIPCGVGGAPGGIAYGLKSLFEENVHIFFIEPTHAPCMTLGMMTGLQDKISVSDVGIDGKTEADGLAVGRPSGFVGGIMDSILDGAFTIEDENLFPLMKGLFEKEEIFIEPSAAASFQGVKMLDKEKKLQDYFRKENIGPGSLHIAWATGGALVPEEIRRQYLEK